MNFPISGKFSYSLILMLGYLGYTACSAPKPLSNSSASNSSDAVPSDGTELPEHCKEFITEEPAEDAAAAFRLVAAPELANYNGGVKTLIDTKCATAGCHAAGATAPEMTDFIKVKAAGARILARSVTASTMPPGNNALDATEKDLLQTWADLGYRELYVAPVVEQEEETPEIDAEFAKVLAVMEAQTCIGSGCHNSTDKAGGAVLDTKDGYDLIAGKIVAKVEGGHFGKSFSAEETTALNDYTLALTGEAPATKEEKKEIPPECKVPAEIVGEKASESDYSKTLNPAKLTECHDEGLLYDRRAKDCHTATFGSTFSCNWEGVKEAFGEIAGTETLLALEGDRFQVDQCGEIDGDPLVLLIRTDQSSGELKLDYKTLSITSE